MRRRGRPVSNVDTSNDGNEGLLGTMVCDRARLDGAAMHAVRIFLLLEPTASFLGPLGRDNAERNNNGMTEETQDRRTMKGGWRLATAAVAIR